MSNASDAPRTIQSGSTAVDLQQRELDRPAGSLYDSEEIPVLIRLPELTPMATAAAPNASSEGPPKEARQTHEDGTRRQRRLDRGVHIRTGRRDANVWASLSPKALVVAFLVAVTGLVYVLVLGGSGGGDGEPATVWSEPNGQPAEEIEPEIRMTPPPSPDRGVELWPGDEATPYEPAGRIQRPSVGGSEGELANGQRAGGIQSWPQLTNPAGANDPAPPGISEPPPTFAIPSHPHATPGISQPHGPVFSWRREESESKQDARSLENSPPTNTNPVLGWPPGVNDSYAVAGPGDLPERAPAGQPYAYPNTGTPPLPENEPSPHGAPPPLRTGMRDPRGVQTQQNSDGSRGAELKGTIELPQPWADYERTRPRLH